jgi:hypothetical protein
VNEFKLQEVKVEDMKLLLQVIYNSSESQIPGSLVNEQLMSLFMISSRFQFKSIFEKIREYLEEKLDEAIAKGSEHGVEPKVALSWLTSALDLNLYVLKKKVKYVLCLDVNNVLSDPSLVEVPFPVMRELLESDLFNAKEMDILSFVRKWIQWRENILETVDVQKVYSLVRFSLINDEKWKSRIMPLIDSLPSVASSCQQVKPRAAIGWKSVETPLIQSNVSLTFKGPEIRDIQFKGTSTVKKWTIDFKTHVLVQTLKITTVKGCKRLALFKHKFETILPEVDPAVTWESKWDFKQLMGQLTAFATGYAVSSRLTFEYSSSDVVDLERIEVSEFETKTCLRSKEEIVQYIPFKDNKNWYLVQAQKVARKKYTPLSQHFVTDQEGITLFFPSPKLCNTIELTLERDPKTDSTKKYNVRVTLFGDKSYVLMTREEEAISGQPHVIQFEEQTVSKLKVLGTHCSDHRVSHLQLNQLEIYYN